MFFTNADKNYKIDLTVAFSFSIQVIKADVYDADRLAEEFSGQDVVLSCLGSPPSYFSLWKVTLYTDTAKSIVTALRKASVKRFIFMSAWHTVCK